MMTIDELQVILDSTPWQKLGAGKYNDVMVSVNELTISGYRGLWVLKKPFSVGINLNHPMRAVRKWNTLNPNYPALLSKKGWIAPYLGNAPASDQQIALKLIDIYRRTKNIIGDAAALGPNFIVYNGEAICVDVDQAYSRNSVDSQDIRIYSDDYFNFLNVCEKNGYPESIGVIKTLLFLEVALQEREIKAHLITPPVMQLLHLFRETKELLTPSQLARVIELTLLIPVDTIRFKQITPAFIRFLQRSLRDQPIPDLEFFNTLLNNYLLQSFSVKDYIDKGCLDKLEILIDHNKLLISQVDEDGYTLLHFAVKCRDINTVSYLIKAGANIHAKVSILSASKDAGLTVLDLACAYDIAQIAIFLFNRGAIFSPYKEGRTHIIHILAASGLLSHLKFMLKEYPDLLDAINNDKNTPLQCAQLANQREVVDFLRAESGDISPVKLPMKPCATVEKPISPLLQSYTMFGFSSMLDDDKAHTKTNCYDGL